MHQLHDDLDTSPQRMVTSALGDGAVFILTQEDKETTCGVKWWIGPQQYGYFDVIDSKEFGTYAEQMEFIHLCIAAALELKVRYELHK